MFWQLLKHKPVASDLYPEDVLEARFLPSLAVIAVPAAFWHFHVQTLPVESSGTRLAAEQAASWSKQRRTTCERQLPAGFPRTLSSNAYSELQGQNRCTFSANEAPADIDVLVVLHSSSRGEVVGTDDAVVGEDDATRCHAEVCGMVGHWAAHAPHQTSWRQQHDGASEGKRVSGRGKRGRARLTFGHVGAVRVGDEAGEADMKGAAEPSANRRSGAKVGDALPVVELAAHRDHAAAHILAAFLANEAGVDA